MFFQSGLFALRTINHCSNRGISRSLRWLTPLLRYRYATRSNGEHYDLSSFLAYAERKGLSPASTLYIGTHYEYIVQQALTRFGLTLSRTGGRLDRGIDLLGAWLVPGLPQTHPLRMLVQCKATSRKAGPNLIRELEGAFAGLPARLLETDEEETLDVPSREVASFPVIPAGKASGTMALLVAPTEATKGVRDALGRSSLPMGFAKVTLNGIVEQILWNRAAAVKGLEGLGVKSRYRPIRRPSAASNGNGDEEEVLQEEIVLMWNNSIWEGFHVD